MLLNSFVSWRGELEKALKVLPLVLNYAYNVNKLRLMLTKKIEKLGKGNTVLILMMKFNQNYIVSPV